MFASKIKVSKSWSRAPEWISTQAPPFSAPSSFHTQGTPKSLLGLFPEPICRCILVGDRRGLQLKADSQLLGAGRGEGELAPPRMCDATHSWAPRHTHSTDPHSEDRARLASGSGRALWHDSAGQMGPGRPRWARVSQKTGSRVRAGSAFPHPHPLDHPLAHPSLSLYFSKVWAFICLAQCICLQAWQRVQFSSVTQSCLTLGDPMNCRIPGLPVHHQFPEQAIDKS